MKGEARLGLYNTCSLRMLCSGGQENLNTSVLGKFVIYQYNFNIKLILTLDNLLYFFVFTFQIKKWLVNTKVKQNWNNNGDFFWEKNFCLYGKKYYTSLKRYHLSLLITLFKEYFQFLNRFYDITWFGTGYIRWKA